MYLKNTLSLFSVLHVWDPHKSCACFKNLLPGNQYRQIDALICNCSLTQIVLRALVHLNMGAPSDPIHIRVIVQFFLCMGQHSATLCISLIILA
jgi:hypothetical protein